MTLQIENIDATLLAEVRRKARVDSNEAAVEIALKEYVAQNRRIPGGLRGDPQKIIELFGTVDFDPEWERQHLGSSIDL